ncbi:MAG TPA: MFS transporter [Chloroflexi bacterium]|nr:MFS transporter [Chloroflexota bacterium]
MREKFHVLLSNRSFARLWVAQFLSLAAVYALNLGAIMLVEEQTHSSIQMSITILTITLPGLFAGLVAGPVVDRFDRRRLLVIANASKALVAGSFFIGLRSLRGAPLLLLVYTVNLCLSSLNQFISPAEAALLPSLVGRDHLIAANSILNLGAIAAQGVGIVVVGPLLIKLLGLASVSLMAMGLSLGAAFSAWALPLQAATSHRCRRINNLWADLREGWGLIAGDQLLKLAVFQMTLASVIMLTLSILLPGFVARTMGWDVSASPLIMLPVGAGFLTGLAVLNRHTQVMKYENWVGIGLLSLGSAISAMALTSGKPPFLLVLFGVVAGAGLSLVFIPAKTILQERPPVNLRGRVISTQMVLVNATSIAPMLLGGSMADAMGIKPTMLLVGLTALMAGALNFTFIAPGRRPG